MTNIYTAKEVASHNHEEDLWIVIHRKVYDLTKFLKEHPGGEEVLLELAGQDGTQCFDNIGHSTEAILLRDSFMIGEISDTTNMHTSTATMSSTINTEKKKSVEDDNSWRHEELKKEKSSSSSSSSSLVIISIGIVVCAAILFYYM